MADEGKDYPFARFNKVSDKRGEIIILVLLLGLVGFKLSSTNVSKNLNWICKNK